MIIREKLGIPRERSLAVLSVVFCALAMFVGTANANETEVGSSKKQFRNEALQKIPYHLLNQETKEKIGDILQKPSIYRRLPVTSIDADPDYFLFLVRYPEVLVNIWQLMGITRMTTERTGPYNFNMNDGAGTISSLELLYGTDNLHVFYGTGTYEGPFLRKKLSGRCVLVLQTQFTQGQDGKPVATNKLDVFLKVDNATIGLIAKSIQPIVGSTADHNFVESLKFVQRLNSTTERNGPGVQGMAKRLNLDTDVRNRFIDVAGVVFERANSRTIRAAYPPSISPMSTQIDSRMGRPNPPMGTPVRTSIPYSIEQRQPGVPQSNAYQQAPDIGQVRYEGSLQSNAVYPNHVARQVEYPAYRPYGYQAPVYRQAQLTIQGTHVPNSVPPIVQPNGYSAMQYATPTGQALRR